MPPFCNFKLLIIFNLKTNLPRSKENPEQLSRYFSSPQEKYRAFANNFPTKKSTYSQLFIDFRRTFGVQLNLLAFLIPFHIAWLV